ncbi:hypothetical protein Dda_1618 [Drechslerella dactyloides]|uniref:Uncharacterized protein n=1 Tax=Drechslerella dactyloides TaxID=74499 RepID=A0AAD6J3T5_DREDA|nr:hypothetical protein Dda_1618 [Drechslerella dactyloides]
MALLRNMHQPARIGQACLTGPVDNRTLWFLGRIQARLSWALLARRLLGEASPSRAIEVSRSGIREPQTGIARGATPRRRNDMPQTEWDCIGVLERLEARVL